MDSTEPEITESEIITREEPSPLVEVYKTPQFISEWSSTEDERQAAHANRIEKAVATGGCPKCGSLSIFDAKDPADQNLSLCHHCGNKFNKSKGVI